MNVEAFLLCKSIQESQDGQTWDVFGIFDTFEYDAVPARLRACALFARLHFDQGESSEHTIVFRLLDDDGHEVVPPSIVEDKEPAKTGGHYSVLVVWRALYGIWLPAFGSYEFRLEIDGRQAGYLPFQVVPRIETMPRQ